MLRVVALLVLLLPACAPSMAAGVASTTAAAGALSLAQRKAGGCYAICTGGTICNPRSGLCERAPCDGLCGRDEHCEASYAETKCAPGAPADVVSTAPGSQKTIPALQPEGVTSGPPQIVPAAERNPTSR